MSSPRIITPADSEKLMKLAELIDTGSTELRRNFATNLSDGGEIWTDDTQWVKDVVKKLSDASAYLRDLAGASVPVGR